MLMTHEQGWERERESMTSLTEKNSWNGASEMEIKSREAKNTGRDREKREEEEHRAQEPSSQVIHILSLARHCMAMTISRGTEIT
jgi:hypothetical protein